MCDIHTVPYVYVCDTYVVCMYHPPSSHSKIHTSQRKAHPQPKSRSAATTMNDNETIAYDKTIAWVLASEVGLADTVEHYDAASSRARSRGGGPVTMLDQVWDRVEDRDDSNTDKRLVRSWIQQGLHQKFGAALSKQATKQWGNAAERRRLLLIAQNASVATHVQQHGGAPGDRFPNDMNVAAARLAGQAEGVLRSEELNREERQRAAQAQQQIDLERMRLAQQIDLERMRLDAGERRQAGEERQQQREAEAEERRQHMEAMERLLQAAVTSNNGPNAPAQAAGVSTPSRPTANAGGAVPAGDLGGAVPFTPQQLNQIGEAISSRIPSAGQLANDISGQIIPAITVSRSLF